MPNKRKLVEGDTATLNLRFYGANVGDVIKVEISTHYPNGNIVSNVVEYEIISDLGKEYNNAQKIAKKYMQPLKDLMDGK